MITQVECPICSYPDPKPHVVMLQFLKADYFGMPVAVPVSYSTCPLCETVFQTERMEDDQLNEWYSCGEYRRICGDPAAIDADELERAVRLSVNAGEWRSHLDIGSSRGCLLENIGAAIQVGVEPNEKYNKNPAAVIVPIIPPSGSFHLVTMIHVLEHMIDPVKELNTVANTLDADGEIWVEVPSKDSPGGPLRLAHLYYFSERSMEALAIQARLRIADIKYTPHMLVTFKHKENQ